MAATLSMPETSLKPGDKVLNCTVADVSPFPKLAAQAVRLDHQASGARILHLHTADPEHLLGIALRTPPPDDTGLPHILEHMVLCGSERYPVKDPFTELLRSSLATFLNAFTASDATMYPCSSLVEKDFFNLASVYCDAVFFPRITEMHFKQEGHHLAFETPGDIESKLTISGIVYNEMKGVFSDLDSLMMREVSRELFPDNAYGLESGGDPKSIPDLTHEQLVEFHSRYYHPSNSFIVVHGPLPTERYVEFLERSALSHFSKIDIDTTIAEQPRWSEPKAKTISYPIAAHESADRKTGVTISWFTNTADQVIDTLAMNVIGSYLIGHAGSPLRKALIDSKLGEELTPSGYAAYMRDTWFLVGLKGSEADKADEIKQVVLETIRKEVEQGLNKEAIESVFHRYELTTRQYFSKGPLSLMRQVYNSWIYDQEPTRLLRIDEHLRELRERYESEPGFFESILKERLLENPHYVVHTYTPDKEHAAAQQKAFEENMAARKAAMSRDELKELAAQQEALKLMQEAPNTPEQLATLPTLELDDVPVDPIELDLTIGDIAGVTLLRPAVPTNGVNYLSLAFDLADLWESDLLDDLPMWLTAMTEMGAGDDDYVRMAEREAACTGGIGAAVDLTGTALDPTDLSFTLQIGTKALDDRVGRALDVLHDRLLRPDLTDMERFRDIVMQTRVGLRTDLVPGGSSYATRYASRHLSKARAINERLNGVTQVMRIDRLADNFDKQRDELIERLLRISEFVRSKAPLRVASFAGSDEALATVSDWITSRIDPASRPTAKALKDQSLPISIEPHPPTEGIALPAEVAFVARAMPFAGYTDPDSVAGRVISTQLRYGYLWDQIRVKGGAYGASATCAPLSGAWTFSSYRDPNILRTIEAYDGVFDYIENGMDLSKDGITRAVIGTVSKTDAPIRPSSAAGVAMSRHITGLSPEIRRQFRQTLLSLTADDIRRAGKRIAGAYSGSPIAVLSSREKIEAANQQPSKIGQFKIVDV